MNLQERSDKRSLALHRAVVKRLREDPSLWAKPLQNIERWTKGGEMPVPYRVWKYIFETKSREDIIKLLLSRSQRATHLRSSSPFCGIISQEERNRIFNRYRTPGSDPANTITIDGYQAVISYDEGENMYRGEFTGLNGGADFYAADITDMRKEGELSLRIFLDACRERGIEPRKAT